MKKNLFSRNNGASDNRIFLMFLFLLFMAKEKNEYQVSGCLSEIIFPNKIKGSEKRRHLKRSTTPYS